MNVMDMVRRKKVTKTTVVEIEEEFEDDIKDEELKRELKDTLSELDYRVAMLEQELELYGRN